MTYREVIYSILDLSKLLVDDIIINEEHVMFLIEKYRASILMQKYKTVKLEVSEANYQELEVALVQTPTISGLPCEGQNYLKSSTTECIPKLIGIGNTVVYPQDFYQGINIVLISRDRMRFIGSNPILRNIVYCSFGTDGKLYFTSANPQFLYLKKIKIVGVFEEPIKAAKMQSTNSCGSNCEDLDKVFPFEEDLMVNLQTAVLKDVIGAAWRPTDSKNNATDDLADLANFVQHNMKSNVQKQIEA